MYGKHFASMYEGSMFGAGANVFAVWGWIISHTVSSTVEINPKILAMTIGMTEADVNCAINYLEQPDPNSRNPDLEGRRIIKEGPFQYRVVSHEVYKSLRTPEDRREYMRLYMKKRRGNKSNKNVGVLTNVNIGKQVLGVSTDTEAYTEEDKNSSPTPEEIYQAYPKHEAKLDALRAIEKTLRSNGHDASWYLGRVEEYARQVKGKDPKYIPLPATWFNKGHYLNESLNPPQKAQYFDAETGEELFRGQL